MALTSSDLSSISRHEREIGRSRVKISDYNQKIARENSEITRKQEQQRLAGQRPGNQTSTIQRYEREIATHKNHIAGYLRRIAEEEGKIARAQAAIANINRKR